MHADARAGAARFGCGHVDARGRGVQQPPVRGRADVAEHRAGPARQHRRQAPPLHAQRGVPDRIDALMQPVKPTSAHPDIHRRGRDAQRSQLSARDDTPLPSGELGQRRERGCAAFPVTMSVNAAHPPSVPAAASHGTPQTQQNSADSHPSLPRPRAAAGAARRPRTQAQRPAETASAHP